MQFTSLGTITTKLTDWLQKKVKIYKFDIDEPAQLNNKEIEEGVTKIYPANAAKFSLPTKTSFKNNDEYYGVQCLTNINLNITYRFKFNDYPSEQTLPILQLMDLYSYIGMLIVKDRLNIDNSILEAHLETDNPITIKANQQNGIDWLVTLNFKFFMRFVVDFDDYTTKDDDELSVPKIQKKVVPFNLEINQINLQQEVGKDDPTLINKIITKPIPITNP